MINEPFISVAFWIKNYVHTRHIKYKNQSNKKLEKKTQNQKWKT